MLAGMDADRDGNRHHIPGRLARLMVPYACCSPGLALL